MTQGMNSLFHFGNLGHCLDSGIFKGIFFFIISLITTIGGVLSWWRYAHSESVCKFDDTC